MGRCSPTAITTPGSFAAVRDEHLMVLSSSAPMTFSIFSTRFVRTLQDRRIIGEGCCTASEWYGEPWAFCLRDQGPVSCYSAHGGFTRAPVFALADSSAANRNAPPMRIGRALKEQTAMIKKNYGITVRKSTPL